LVFHLSTFTSQYRTWTNEKNNVAQYSQTVLLLMSYINNTRPCLLYKEVYLTDLIYSGQKHFHNLYILLCMELIRYISLLCIYSSWNLYSAIYLAASYFFLFISTSESLPQTYLSKPQIFFYFETKYYLIHYYTTK